MDTNILTTKDLLNKYEELDNRLSSLSSLLKVIAASDEKSRHYCSTVGFAADMCSEVFSAHNAFKDVLEDALV